MSLLDFDPLKIVNEIIVIGAVTVGVVVVWINRARVLQAITGDDKIHGDCLDFMWFACCQGCGLCTGDWTRCLTTWPCCPKRLRGANLVQVLGQCFGLTPYTVEIKNIVCGDLPYDGLQGDFYLAVENSANPAMMSSLAEEKHPKVVHFPEVMTVRLRWSHLEEPLVITVKELNILGSQDLCQCRLSPMHILDWCDDPHERIKRFELKSADHTVVRDTPAWILLEFDHPSEARDLDNFHGDLSAVRTATRDGHYTETPLNRFKREYVLLDADGHPMDEVPEEDLWEMERLRACASTGFWFCNLVTVTAVVTYVSMRAYVSSCHREYRWLTMAYMNRADFPIFPERLQRVVEQCELLVQRDGAEQGTPCRPNTTNVMGLCSRNSTGGHFPGAQARPTAFSNFARRRLGLQVGVPCLNGVCSLRDHLVKLDLACIAGCIVLVLINFLLHLCMRRVMRSRKKARQHSRLDRRRQQENSPEQGQRSRTRWP